MPVTKHPSSNNPHLMLRRLAVAATGLTGADVERAIKEARQTSRRLGRPLDYADLERTILRGRTVQSPEVRWKVAVHEAGHAVAWMVTDRGRVQRMTVGPSAGGRTEVQIKTNQVEDEALFQDVLCCLLSGRAAEWTIFGETYAGSGGGADSDLALATVQAIRMEAEMGMSKSTPLLFVPATSPGHDLRLDPALARAVNLRLEAAYDRAKVMMEEHRAMLHDVAKELAERTVLEAIEIEALLTLHLGPRPG